MHQRHIANSIRKRLRELEGRVDDSTSIEGDMAALVIFVTEMQNLATRIDTEQDIEEKK